MVISPQEQQRRQKQRSRSIAIALGLASLVVIFYAAIIVRYATNPHLTHYEQPAK